MDLQVMVRQFGRSVDRNSPTILTALAVAGVVGTVIAAIRATPKAQDLIDREKQFRYEEYGDEDPITLTPIELAQVVWKPYLPTVVIGGVTIACIIGANHISLRRNAALVSLLSLAETAAKEYQAKVVEHMGEKKEATIRDEIIQDRLDKNPVKDSTVILTGKGEYLICDNFSGRYFRSDVETIRRVVNDFNQRLIKCAPMFLPINDFFYELGLEPVTMGDEIGWNAEDNMLEVRWTTKMTDDGPCAVMDYPIWPKHY